jgi:hypothetical protein
MNLRNTGIGPARIEGVRVLHKGSVIQGDAYDFYVKMRRDPNQPSNNDPIKVGRMVSAGEWVQMIGGTGDEAARETMATEIVRLFDIAEVSRAMYKYLNDVKGIEPEAAVLEVTYSSVFGQQWVLRSGNMVPQAR